MNNYHLISIIIPTYNEKDNIANCLNSIFRQRYPREKLEVFIVDAGSSDNTLELAQNFPVRILENRRKDPEIAKMIGLKQAKGDLFFYLDADIELVGDYWFENILKPFIRHDNLAGVFPRFVPKKSDYAISRFLRYHPLELDPILQFFCTEIKDTVVENDADYKICEFIPPRVPPIGICLYKRDILIKAISEHEKFMDIDVPVILAKKGFNRFAYVSQCGIYHPNVKNLNELIKKRLRNIYHIYLPNISTRQFTYFPSKYGVKNLIKIGLCILYAESFIFSFLKGCYGMLKYKDVALLYESIVAFSLVNAIIFNLLRHREGQRFIRKCLFGKIRYK